MTAIPLSRSRDEQVAVVASIARDILCAALAGVVSGILVAGIGGRIVMRVAAMLNPQAAGRFTENGEVVGEITLGGTVALIVFGGMVSGLVAAPVWAAIAAWIPGRGIRRALVTVPIAVALGAPFLIRSDNNDFRILAADALLIGLLVGLVALFGFAFALAVDWADRRFPRPGPDPREYLLAAGSVVLFGVVLVLPITVGFYFSGLPCDCALAPIPLGVPLGIASVATLASWWQRTQGRGRPSPPVALVGGIGLLGAVGLGITLLASEVTRILS